MLEARDVTVLAFCLVSLGCTSPDGERVALPDGSSGIGFDDLRYSSSLRRVLAPAGRSGNLILVWSSCATSATAAFQRIQHLEVRYLAYGELEKNREQMTRFGSGLRPIEAIARRLT